MSTIRDVSKQAGLSIATVSRALSTPEKVSPESLKRVQAAIEKLQYRPNMLSQKFRHNKANSIVVLVPNIANLFFSTVISGIENVAQKHGFNVLLGDTRDSLKREQEFVHLVETRQADGLIQLRPYRPNNSLLPKAHVTAVNASGCENTPYPSVRIDNIAAAKEVVKYLISLGHKRIGIISGLKDNPHAIERLKGYKLALSEAGIDFDAALLAEGDFTFWSGLNASEHFSRMQNPPTALFCMNDEMAIGAIKGLKNKGFKIPEQISVTGFDDLEFAKYCDSALTTIAQPAEKIGEKAAELLFQLLDGCHEGNTEFVLPYEFVIRQSTAQVASKD